MEAKIEELRKSAFQEINRIEMLFEVGNESTMGRIQQIVEKQDAECAHLLAKNNEVLGKMMDFEAVIHLLNKTVEKCKSDLKYMKENSPEAKLNDI